MFKNNKKEIFSIRKIKNGRADSIKVGSSILISAAALFNNVAPTIAAETNGNQLPEIVGSTDKVASDKSVTFIDNNDSTKKIKVDAVLDKGVAEPVKANSNLGEKDGTDVLNIKSKTNVNYYLEEDNSKLKDTITLETGTGAILTDYNKNGLAFDIDGKSYKNSIVNKDGISVTEKIGKEDIIKTNGKAYKLKKSEVLGSDKLNYDKTNFNNIEVLVSPENMNNENGINYTNLTGKVYIVEENSDGVYGKFVETNNVTDDEKLIKAWNDGKSNAKDFTKENVKLEVGDSIVVIDKDTYATGSGTERVKVSDVVVEAETEATPPIDATRKIKGNEILPNTEYKSTISSVQSPVNVKESSNDYIFGTQDDLNKTIENVSILKFDTTEKPENKSFVLSNSINDWYSGDKTFYTEIEILNHTDKLDVNKATLLDILKDINSLQYRLVEFFEESETSDKSLVSNKKEILNNYMNEIANFVKDNNIKLGILNNEVIFYHENSDKLTELKNKIENTKTILNELRTNDSVDSKYTTGKKILSNLVYNSTNPHLLEGVVKIEYHEDSAGAASSRRESKTITSDETRDVTKLTLNGKVNINDKTVSLNDTKTVKSSDELEYTETETTTNITYNVKEVISPVRAYKVVENSNPTVNHYYTLKTEPEELKEIVETKGSVVVKYVDQNGNEIKAPNTVVPETVIKTVKKYETKSDITAISTREDVTDNTTTYNTKSVLENEIRTEDGKLYRYRAILPTDSNLNNTTDETGNVKEGVTTIIYQYDLIIPVDPTQPKTPETSNLPQPEDKISNDPQNRTYKDLGLIKNVERTITYIYEDGPKARQEASTPVKQKARFTRTAEINARTGEVTYKTEWTSSQKLNEVKSPAIENYLVDKDKVEELTVSNTSENTNVVVKYREAVKYIEHDADKDKKGTVIVKYIDANGTVLKEVKVKENVLVAKASTQKYTDREETTYTPTNEKYSVEKEKEFTIDEIKFVFNKLVPVNSKYNNTTKENGTVKEGITTVVYEYKPVLPSNDIVNEKTEFNGGINPIDPPVVDIPEYKEPIGGAIVPPEVHEKTEFKGGISPIDPPVVEKPEAKVPKVEEPKKEEEQKEVIKKKEELPVTSSSSMLGMFGLVGAFGMRKKRKKDK